MNTAADSVGTTHDSCDSRERIGASQGRGYSSDVFVELNLQPPWVAVPQLCLDPCVGNDGSLAAAKTCGTVSGVCAEGGKEYRALGAARLGEARGHIAIAYPIMGPFSPFLAISRDFWSRFGPSLALPGQFCQVLAISVHSGGFLT